MKFFNNAKVILKETFGSPTKNSYVTIVNGKRVVLREGGVYKGLNLQGADLSGAHLNNIDFEGADLTGANMVRAHFHGANFKGAKLGNAVVSGADFTGAIMDLAEGAVKGMAPATRPVGHKTGGGNGD